MESNGVPGSVQLSAAAWDALRLGPEADAEPELPPAAERDIKGKGRMRTRTVRAGTPAAARLRALVDVPWPGAADERVSPPGPPTAKPPRYSAPASVRE